MRTRTPKKLRPAVNWHGSKYYLARRIVSLFPDHRTYVEPYAGGLNVLLNKWRTPVEVAGDLNGPLIEFYKILQARPKELISRLQFIDYTRENFRWACRPSEDQDPIDIAVRFLVRNRFSSGGLGKKFAWCDRPRGKTRLCGPRPGDQSAWEMIVEEHLHRTAQRLQGVQFYHADALDQIQRFDNPETLHYLDPTYLPETRTSPKIYAHEMSREDHERLLETILHIQGMVVLSGYPSKLYDEALTSWDRHEYEMANHSGQGKTKQRRTEVLWLSPNCDRFELRG
jgi:DNA adenine methylase